MTITRDRDPSVQDFFNPGQTRPVYKKDNQGNTYVSYDDGATWTIIPELSNSIRNPDEMEWNPEENREILSRRGLPSEGNKEREDPHDGSVWLIDIQGNKIKRLSGPIPGWIPGRGVPAPQQAPQRTPQTAAEI